MRNKKNVILGAVVAVLVLVAIAGGAYALKESGATARVAQVVHTDQVRGGNIAIVDVNRLMAESLAAQSVQKQLDEKRAGFQKEFADIERDLREQEKKIIESKARIPAEQFERERVAFEQKLTDVRKLVQERRQSLDDSAMEAVASLRLEITKIVADMAKTDGYALILNRQNVVLAEETLDVTELVMERLNRKLKEIKIKPDAGKKKS